MWEREWVNEFLGYAHAKKRQNKEKDNRQKLLLFCYKNYETFYIRFVIITQVFFPFGIHFLFISFKRLIK